MSTTCIICHGPMAHFMSKHFTQFDLGNVDYVQCATCGFVMSQTHYDMSDCAWEALNAQWVSMYQGTDHNPEDPRWLERSARQAIILADAASIGLLPSGRWLDFGAGDGKLADTMAIQHGLTFEKYEHSSNPAAGYLSANELIPKAFSVVLHTAVMEHLRFRSQIDLIFDLVSDDGVMALHTWVAEHVPQDPDWFYLLCVHCSFYSNRSMQQLFTHHGYTCSIYHVASRLWLWFKRPANEVRAIIDHANARSPDKDTHYLFAEAFLGYWH